MRFLIVVAVVAGFCGAARAQVFRPRARTPATIAKANANAAVLPTASKTAPVVITPKKTGVRPVHIAKQPARAHDDDDVIVDDDDDAKPVKKKPIKKAPKPPKDDSFSITDD